MRSRRLGCESAGISVLDPEVVLRVDGGATPARGARFLRGAAAVAEQSVTFARTGAGEARPALVNGAAGAVFVSRGQPFAVVGFTVGRGRIVAIDVLADPDRVRQVDLATLDD